MCYFWCLCILCELKYQLAFLLHAMVRMYSYGKMVLLCCLHFYARLTTVVFDIAVWCRGLVKGVEERERGVGGGRESGWGGEGGGGRGVGEREGVGGGRFLGGGWNWVRLI